MTVTLLRGDCRDVLPTLPGRSVQCIVTSPPYFGLRAYGDDARELGREPTPTAYVAALVDVFRACRRVLRDDGVLWVNIGDSYGRGDRVLWAGDSQRGATDRKAWEQYQQSAAVLPEKNLLGIPWRLALALQDDGWVLRADIVWAKPNPMPESVRDRPTRSHEYVFLFAKQPRYFYDAEAIAERASAAENRGGAHKVQDLVSAPGARNDGFGERWQPSGTRNARSVWTIATQPNPDAHYAMMPEALARRCILAGTSPQACERCGAPWARVVEKSRATHERVDDPTPLTGRKGMNRKRPGISDRYVLSMPQHELAQRLRDAANGRAGEMRDRFGSKWDHWTRTDSNGARVPTFEDAEQIKALLGVDIPFDGTPGGFAPTCACPDTTGSARCVVLDPFGGAGTTGRVAERLQRDAVLIELYDAYIDLQERRTNGVQTEMPL